MMSIKQSAKRWQKLAGVIKENRNYPVDEKDFDLDDQDDDIYATGESEQDIESSFNEPTDDFVPAAGAFGHSGDYEDYFDSNVEAGHEIKNLSVAELIDRGYSEEEIVDFIKSVKGKDENLDENIGKDLFNKEEEKEKEANPEKVFADTELSTDGDEPDPNDLKIIFGDEEETKQEERMVGHTGGPSREGHALLTKEEHEDDFDLSHLFDEPEEEDFEDEEMENYEDDEYVDISGVEDEMSGMYDVRDDDWMPKLNEGSEDRTEIIWHLKNKGMSDSDILDHLTLALSDTELKNALEEYLDDFESEKYSK